jgi:hypothetical protein
LFEIIIRLQIYFDQDAFADSEFELVFFKIFFDSNFNKEMPGALILAPEHLALHSGVVSGQKAGGHHNTNCIRAKRR